MATNHNSNQDMKKLIKELNGLVFKGSEFFEKKKMEKLVSIVDLLDGELIKSDSGQFFLKRTVIPTEEIRNGFVGNGLKPFPTGYENLNPKTLSIIGRDSEIESTNPLKFLYLDTETTGLAGGTGTFAFLVGCGYFRDNTFIIEQFFMEDYQYELAMLEFLKNFLSGFEGFVTFNGKCFDIPLLKSRFIYNRIPVNLEIPNLDLLFIARRFWKRRLGDCSLQNLEVNLFDIKRENDIPSELIPYVYFDYVRGIRRERMVNVFNHNQQDIVSLALITILAHNIYESPHKLDFIEPVDLYSLALTYQRDNFYDRAVECFWRALKSTQSEELEFHIRGKLSMLYKKMQDYESAVNIWFDLIDRFEIDDVFHFEELAKYFEHKQRDYDRAISIVQKAIQKIEILCEVSKNDMLQKGKYNAHLESLKKRLKRLKRKINRAH